MKINTALLSRIPLGEDYSLYISHGTARSTMDSIRTSGILPGRPLRIQARGCISRIYKNVRAKDNIYPNLERYDLRSECYVQIRFGIAINLGAQIFLMPGQAIVTG